MSNGVTFCDREVVEDHNQRPRGFQIAHINRMVICHLWGVREKRNSKRAQKIKLNKLSGSRLALCVNWVKKRFSEPLHARSRLGGGCLSIVKLSRHHSVVGRSLIHRSDPLTWPHATISVTLGALLSRLVRPIRERIWWYARVCAVGWPVFEHCEAVLTPLGGGTVAHSPI
jgi:hypothetical protein